MQDHPTRTESFFERNQYGIFLAIFLARIVAMELAQRTERRQAGSEPEDG